MISNLALRLSMLRARLLPRKLVDRKQVPQRDTLQDIFDRAMDGNA